LVDAGLRVVRMGIQTASESTKKLYKRNYSQDIIKKAVLTINSFKDKLKMIFYDIIVDNPWESDDQLVETLMFFSELPPPYYLNLFSLTFYPGTELYTVARRDGIIKDDLNDVYRKYYHSYGKTYFNMLFVLQGEYTKRGMRIPSAAMAILTDRFVRRSGLGWIFLALVKLPIIISRFFYLMREGFNAVRAKDISRIVRYVIRRTR
ncbi:MAG: hypothetical protein NT066_06465, partial [Candidatus Omnitrophica bacterium]|nr:hypothetical protein [Candidatus Omnitrophota bacterium]